MVTKNATGKIPGLKVNVAAKSWFYIIRSIVAKVLNTIMGIKMDCPHMYNINILILMHTIVTADRTLLFLHPA